LVTKPEKELVMSSRWAIPFDLAVFCRPLDSELVANFVPGSS
jgi:hypothetical protein